MDTDRIPRETVIEGTNKVAMSRTEVADLFCPTTQMEPLFADEEHHVLVSSDPLQVLMMVGLRAAGLERDAPIAIEDTDATDTTMKHSYGTSLGVAPLEPATTVRAPFVVDTPVPRRSLLGRTAWPQSSANIPIETSRERTAMVALDPSSGMPRLGPWHAIVKSLRSVRWWRRHKTSRIRPLRR